MENLDTLRSRLVERIFLTKNVSLLEALDKIFASTEIQSEQKIQLSDAQKEMLLLADEDINLITETYHNWRKSENYEDIKGFCRSATIEEIEKHNHVLTPGRYVGIEAVEDDGISFETKMSVLTATLKNQMDKEVQLNDEIVKQLSKIGLTL